MKRALMMLFLWAPLLGCGSGKDEASIDTEESVEEEVSPVLLGTYSFREDVPDNNFAAASCLSNCGVEMWPLIRVYQDDRSIDIKDTKENLILSGTLNDDGAFDFSFMFADLDEAESRMECVAVEESQFVHSCLGVNSKILKASCYSQNYGQCMIYYNQL